MKKIFLFEPCIGSDNLGDQIIVDSIKKELKNLFDNAFCIELPTHLPLSKRYMYFLKKPDLKFICGSNILVTNFFHLIHLKQWMIGITSFHIIRGSVFIGVGAQNRIKKYGIITGFIYRFLFQKNLIHSVRDEYTIKLLKKAGINNVINTACPSMWRFSPAFCRCVPKKKSNTAIITLTDYNQNPQRDKFLIKTVIENYEDVYFWPQGMRDYTYFKSLRIMDKIGIIPPSLSAYDDFLSVHDVDFIGTRLHGGIRALQHKKRTIIIGIDNRAIELRNDFNIPVIDESNINDLSHAINNDVVTDIKLPINNIKLFLEQFGLSYE